MSKFVRLQDKGKQAIFFACLGLCAVPRGLENRKRKDPECEPAQRFAREVLELRVFSTSAGARGNKTKSQFLFQKPLPHSLFGLLIIWRKGNVFQTSIFQIGRKLPPKDTPAPWFICNALEHHFIAQLLVVGIKAINTLGMRTFPWCIDTTKSDFGKDHRLFEFSIYLFDFGLNIMEVSLQLLYHNHDFEFKPNPDYAVVIDYLFENCNLRFITFRWTCIG